MDLSEIINMQMEFDNQHRGNFRWDEKITEDNIAMLEYLVLAIAGEVGETANIVKKIIRGDFSLKDKKNELETEIIDIFIYIIKLAYQMNIDIENVYLQKLKYNQRKFKDYEK
jgi:NTP pyrophosphatase (non-canonical NTP hydrolase)